MNGFEQSSVAEFADFNARRNSALRHLQDTFKTVLLGFDDLVTRDQKSSGINNCMDNDPGAGSSSDDKWSGLREWLTHNAQIIRTRLQHRGVDTNGEGVVG